jgi:hypothetical protein
MIVAHLARLPPSWLGLSQPSVAAPVLVRMTGTSTVDVFISGTGARVVIASDDHRPPHIHAFHRAEGWIVRLWFSYASVDAGVLSIAPTGQAMRQRQLNQLLDEIEDHKATCRRIWWHVQGTTCLPNKWVVAASGGLTVLDAWRTGARQIEAAFYDSAADATRIVFRRGGEMTVETHRGDRT